MQSKFLDSTTNNKVVEMNTEDSIMLGGGQNKMYFPRLVGVIQ